MFYVQLILASIAAGSLYSLAGMGLVLTYRATGIFNFAHGAIAVFTAYVYWQLSFEWGVPVGLAAAFAMFVVGPGIGLALERAVFRPLQQRGAPTSERLVATVGTFVLFLGIVVVTWTFERRRVPGLFSNRSIEFRDDLRIGFDQLCVIVFVLIAAAGLWALFTRTHFGTELRAVVDRRELAELTSINANRVSSVAWALGTAMSGMTGVLFVTLDRNLDPFSLSLFMIETFSIAVIARLTSLPIAVGSGIVLLGIGDSLFKEIELFGSDGVVGETFNQLKPNVSVLLLFAALLIYRRLDVIGEESTALRRPSASGSVPPFPQRWLVGGVVVLFMAAPFVLDRSAFDQAHRMLAMVIIFASIVAITGFSGHITLGQAGFAGLGAFASARLANSAGVPVVLSMVMGALIVMAVGLAAGFPALRRRGLFLGLTTLATGLMLSRFVLESFQFAGGVGGLGVERPTLFGWSLAGDTAFYYFGLVWVGIVLLLARNLRSGRLGRALAAMRDSEPGAKSVGIDLRAYKLFIFGVSAFMAGIGGALLTQAEEQFVGVQQFNPLNSLFWFAAVVVAGVGSLGGAVLGGFIFVMLDALFERQGISQFVIGLAALSLGFLPGGSLTGVAREVYARIRVRADADYSAALARRAPAASVPYVASGRARELLEGYGPSGNGGRRSPARSSTRKEKGA